MWHRIKSNVSISSATANSYTFGNYKVLLTDDSFQIYKLHAMFTVVICSQFTRESHTTFLNIPKKDVMVSCLDFFGGPNLHYMIYYTRYAGYNAERP